MKRFTAAEARARLSDVLDHAEAGSVVVIERRGVRFRLVPDRARARSSRTPLVEILDDAVERGQWTWTLGVDGMKFAARSRRPKA